MGPSQLGRIAGCHRTQNHGSKIHIGMIFIGNFIRINKNMRFVFLLVLLAGVGQRHIFCRGAACSTATQQTSGGGVINNLKPEPEGCTFGDYTLKCSDGLQLTVSNGKTCRCNEGATCSATDASGNPVELKAIGLDGSSSSSSSASFVHLNVYGILMIGFLVAYALPYLA